MASISENVTHFFFQAEDGIRDLTVTGVQTCALPISSRAPGRRARGPGAAPPRSQARLAFGCGSHGRSGERGVGEEGRSRGAADHLKKKIEALNEDGVAKDEGERREASGDRERGEEER